MKKIYLEVGAHPRYYSLVKKPPQGFYYKIKGDYGVAKYYNSRNKNFLRTISNYVIKYLGIPRVFYYKDAYDCDLIYSTRGIIPLNMKPFIVEGEHFYSFVGLKGENYGFRQKFWINKLLSRKYAKKIIMVSKAASEITKKEFPNLSEKIDYVYQVPIYHKIEKKPHEGINISIANVGDVYSRGFRILFNVVKKLRKHYDVKLLVLTNNLLPQDQKEIKKYGILINNTSSIESGPYHDFWSLSDIFVYLSFFDTVGNVTYDAMMAGVPLVLSNIIFNREKVENYVNGFLVDLPFSQWDEDGKYREIKVDLHYYTNEKVEKDLYEKLKYLIENEKEREKMGKYNLELIRRGKFSIYQRNKKLKKIFEEALSS